VTTVTVRGLDRGYVARMHGRSGFSLRRRIPTSSKVLWTLAATCAAISFVLVRGEASRAATSGDAPEIPVVVAAHDIDAGSSLGGDDLIVRSVPPAAELPATFAAPDAVIGRVAVTSFLAGEPITSTRLAAVGGALASSLPPGSVAVTLGVDAAPDGLVAGDHVDVFATYAGARPYTATVAEDVRVLAIGAGEAGAFAVSERGTRITFTAAPDVARTLAGADASAVLTLALRSPSATAS
jgi:pilus assembly protein CpaB